MAAAVIAVVDMGPAGAVWWQFLPGWPSALHTLVWQVMAAHASNSNSPCWQLCSNSNDPSVQSWAWQLCLIALGVYVGSGHSVL
jgi:hypothetical protein